MKVELTIKVDYLPNWGLFEGLRELLQNAKDAETEFSAPMTVRMKGDRTLVIENEGCTMPYEALLLGHTSKVGRGELIGKFGEGLKLGILALLREGHTVKVRNGGEVWVPQIVWSEVFSAKVLAFDIQKGRKQENRIAFEVSGVDADYFRTELAAKFLWLSKEKPGKDRVVTDAGSLLLSEVHRGKVFVKGIFVEHKPALSVGYDLKDCDVDRDRRMVDSYDFSWKTRQIWSEAVGQRPDMIEAYLDLIEANGLEVNGMSEYSASLTPEAVQALAVETFVKRHGEMAIPVANLAESHEVEHFGRTGVVVNGPLRTILEGKFGKLANIREKLKNEVTRTYSWDELAPDGNNLLRAVGLVSPHAPISLEDIEVVDFRSEELRGLYCNGKIQIARKVVTDRAMCLRVLVHEVAHCLGSDGEKGHVAEIERIWSQIVDTLTST